MPSLPRPQCNQYGCKAPTIKGSVYCVDHSPIKTLTNDRVAFNKPYKTRAWEVIRIKQLTTQPLCQCCLLNGRINSASHVDHLFAWNQLSESAFKFNIFQSLCINCHGIKSGLEKRGIYRHYTPNGERDYSITDYSAVMAKINT